MTTDITLSTRVTHLKPSPTLELAATAKAMKASGIDVVSLAAGEPDFNTPEAIQKAAAKAMADGLTKYTPAQGFLQLREVLSAAITHNNHFDVSPEQVIVTAGAKHAIYLALQCLVDPGQAVLLPTPAWVSYQPMIELAGGKTVSLPLHEQDAYELNIDRWKDIAIPPNTVGIIINTPNNPTGAVYSKAQLEKLSEWALERNLWILSDEIYEHILYDGATHTSIASLGQDVAAKTITVSGFSKSHCMTGWRLGWAVTNTALIKKMAELQSQEISHVTSFVQWAGITAAKMPPSDLVPMVSEFKKRRDYCIARLEALRDYLSYSKPDGAFYLYLNLARYLNARGISDTQLCQNLLSEHKLAVVPGSSFGGCNTLRLSYATSIDQLEKAFDRLDSCLRV